jgi:hypothetical protein
MAKFYHLGSDSWISQNFCLSVVRFHLYTPPIILLDLIWSYLNRFLMFKLSIESEAQKVPKTEPEALTKRCKIER